MPKVSISLTLFVTDSKYELTYCNSCNESVFYREKRGIICQKCKSYLMYKCGRCARFYKSIKALRNHLRLECNKERTHCCNFCDYKAYQKANLANHMRAKHLPQSSQKCYKCDKNFTNRSHLTRHLKVSCNRLKKKFKRWY